MPALKWLAILLPLAFLSLCLYLVTGPLRDYTYSPLGFLLSVVALAVAVSVFASAIFAAIGRLQRALVQRNREMEALLATAREVATSLDMDEVLRRATRAVVEATTAEAAEVWLVDRRRHQVVMRQHYGADAEAFLERTVFPLGEGFPGVVAATGRPLVVHDLPNHPGFLRRQVKGLGFHTLCAFPLTSREGVMGVLAVAGRSSQALTAPQELRLLEAMQDHIAIALENARLHQQVQSLAMLTERERIARELHDGMAQVLTYINSKALAVERLLERGQLEEARGQLSQMADVARDLYAEVREAVLSLRTRVSKEGDLLSILKQYVEEFQDLSGLSIHLREERASELLALLSPIEEIQVLRIIQEALSNVRQHARATKAQVILKGGAEEQVVMVKDNGQGFDPQRLDGKGWPRFGLQTMDERARAIGGCFCIKSKPGLGTTVILKIPRTPPSEDRREDPCRR
jgi:signal transduction histidine kinase